MHTDDTGWRVRGEPAFLMAFETDTAIVSHVRPRHRHEEVQEVIPVDYEGVMVTDRGRSYDAQAFDDAGTTWGRDRLRRRERGATRWGLVMGGTIAESMDKVR